MIINITYDSSVASAPAGFMTAVNYVVGLYDATFANNVTINLDIGWGEIDGQTITGNTLGESLTAGSFGYSFAQVSKALNGLTAAGDVTGASALPATDPTGGSRFFPGTAEARALGLLSATSTTVDGYVGLGAGANFNFSPSSQGVSGKYDAIGVLEHEISEVMGRIAGLSRGNYSIFDLYRYSGPGAIDVNGNFSDYFSTNQGTTNLDNFNTDSSGDLGDWASSAGVDPFLAFSSSGRANRLSTTDMTVMAALGWNDTPIPMVSALLETPLSGSVSAGQRVTIALDFNADMTVSGSPTLALSDGGTASYVGGSGTHGLIFQYTAPVGEAAPVPTTVNLNGGAIANSVGDAANLTLAGVAVSSIGGITSGGAGSTVLPIAGSAFLVSGGGANDTVTGVSGVNTAVFTGALAQYFVSESGSTVSVTDGLPGRDGAATLINIQQAKFSDITLVFDLHSSQDLLVYELYQAAFARIPDLGGFRFWANVADTTNASAVSLADVFIASAEFTAKYGANPSNTTYVTELYTNVLDRTPDQAGLNYWIGQANAGMAHDQLLVAFATSAENVQLIGQHVATGYWTS